MRSSHPQPALATTPSPIAEGGQWLAQAAALLGPGVPMPALFEEVVRAWRGLPVTQRRLLAARELLATIRSHPAGLDVLQAALTDPDLPAEHRLAAGCLLALAPEAPISIAFPTTLPTVADDIAWVAPLLAAFTRHDPDQQYLRLVEALLAAGDGGAGLPSPLLLLGFMKGLCDGNLPETLFGACVLRGRVLHPRVAHHRPFRYLHRLLDYLGLQSDPTVQHYYRELVARVWPLADAENWSAWQWIAFPGGQAEFLRAVQALSTDALTLPGMHTLTVAPLPPLPALQPLLAELSPAAWLLLCWLRPELARRAGIRTEECDGARWLTGSMQAAAQTAYEAPDWWERWRVGSLTAVRQACARLDGLALPPEAGGNLLERQAWLETYYLHGYPAIRANTLLLEGAAGEGVASLRALAGLDDLPALRALALLPETTPDDVELLRRKARSGGRPVQAAARAALAHVARRQGLPDADELDRQHLLATAWELGPLAGERVRTDWQVDGCRLRLSLHHGQVRLEALGPHGPLPRLPGALRTSDAYREARAAQKTVQAQYRLFKGHLEQALLRGQPFGAGEFRYLLQNTVFAHVAERLVWQTGQGQTVLWSGEGRWETCAGAPVELADALTLTVVHPVTLALADTLTSWQGVAADRRLVQPFKQLFREVYTAEGEAGHQCTRFAGREVAPHRAYAVLRAAGFAPGSGVARREWGHGVTAHLCWAEGARGRDLFGPHQRPSVTSGAIWFTRGDTPLSLAQVDPVYFSETLRTADLLTTRAAAMAELTSREAVALRATLLRQVTRSFRLTNVVVPENGMYAIVLGTRATYRVNLTTGIVLLEPEGRQIVVPEAHAQWLPVEEADPTSQVLAIIFALAHDERMADLTFLAQLPANSGVVQ